MGDIEIGYENFCERICVDSQSSLVRDMYMPMIITNWKVNMGHEMTEHDVRIEIARKRTGISDPYDEKYVISCRNKWMDDDATTHENPEEMEDGIFECWKCRNAGRMSMKTKYVQRQTRSADEPMTNFVTCMMCKSNWTCS